MDERDKKFRQARREILDLRTEILGASAEDLTKLLNDANGAITAVLARQPSDYLLWSLPLIQAEIRNVLAELTTAASASISSAAVSAWDAGAALIDVPIAAGGVNIVAQLPRIDTGQLNAMRTFMTDRIANISAQALGQVHGQLGLVLIGAQSPSDAVSNVQQILEGTSRKRAITIVRTELGRAFATASHERSLQASELLPGLQKQWRRSGKIHSRPQHDRTDGQIRPVDKPFIIGIGSIVSDERVGGPRLMYPHDPKGPASETVNCGCVSLPLMADWTVTTPGLKPFSEEEIRLNPLKADFERGPNIADLMAR